MPRTKPYNFRLVQETELVLRADAERLGMRFGSYLNLILAEKAFEVAKRRKGAS